MLKSVHIIKGTTTSKTGTIQRKSTINFPSMPRRNFGRFVRDIRRVEDLKVEVIKKTNLTKRSERLRKRQISCSAPSRN